MYRLGIIQEVWTIVKWLSSLDRHRLRVKQHQQLLPCGLRIQPPLLVLVPQDHWHPIMQLPDRFVRRRRDDRAGLHTLTALRIRPHIPKGRRARRYPRPSAESAISSGAPWGRSGAPDPDSGDSTGRAFTKRQPHGCGGKRPPFRRSDPQRAAITTVT